MYRIYFLSSSEKPNVPRYVGETSHPINRRLSDHKVKSRTRNAKHHQWIRSVIESGHEVLITALIEGLPSREESRKKEARIVKEFREVGFDLLNETDGGTGGVKGKKPSEETRKKWSISRIGNKNAVGNKNWLGKKHSEESKKKMSEKKKARKIKTS